MLRLMKLEFKKNKMGGYIKGATYACFFIVLFICFINWVEMSEGNLAFKSYNEAFSMVGTLTRATFMIFASVIISKLIIEEYRNKTISLLFVYPISRKKLMISKIIIVAGFTFATILLSNLFIGLLLWIADSTINIIPNTLTIEVLRINFIKLIFGSISAAGIGLIPLYFGMRKKSVPATIVSSIFIVTLINSNTEGVSLFNIVAIPILMAIIGVLIAYFSIRKIDKVDIV